MKSFEELMAMQYEDYEEYEAFVKQGSSKKGNFNPNNVNDNVDNIKDYMFLRAKHEEKMNDEELRRLFEELLTKDSQIDRIARAIGSFGADNPAAREKEVESQYFKDIVYDSVRDGYNHATEAEINNYYIAAQLPDGLEKNQQQRENAHREIPKRREEYTVFPAVEVNSYKVQHHKEIKDEQRLMRFQKTLKKVNNSIAEDIQTLLKDNEKRIKNAKGKKDPRSESYKNYVTAAQNYKDALDSGTPAEIRTKLEHLRDMSAAYAVEHNKLTKAVKGMGVTRLRGAQKITAAIDSQISTLDDMYRQVHGTEMKQDTETSFTNQVKLSNLTNAKYRICSASMERLNTSYNQAIQQQVIAAANKDFSEIRNDPKLSPEERTEKQKQALIDQLATAITVSTLAQSIKKDIQSIKNADLTQEKYEKAKQKMEYIYAGSKHLLKPKTVHTASGQLKERTDFQRLVQDATKSPESMKHYENLLKKGDVTMLHNSLNHHQSIIQQEEKLKEQQAAVRNASAKKTLTPNKPAL